MRRLRHWRTTLLSCACVCACVCVWCAVWLWAWLWARLSCLWGVLYPRLCGSLLVCARFVCKKRLLYFCGTQAQGAHSHTGWLCVTCVL